jgi:hypothetical protein
MLLQEITLYLRRYVRTGDNMIVQEITCNYRRYYDTTGDNMKVQEKT